MSDNLIHLEIVTPSKVVFSGEVKSFTAPGSEGSFQILAKHAPFISVIVPGVAKLVTKEGETKKFATSGGTVEVHSSRVIMLAEDIFPSEEINTELAKAEIEEAQKILDSKEPGIDRTYYVLKLDTARAKLKAAGS